MHFLENVTDLLTYSIVSVCLPKNIPLFKAARISKVKNCSNVTPIILTV